MLVRLTGARRSRAGQLLALLYMLCVLAPGLAFAFGDGQHGAPCLTDEEHVGGFMHVHEAGSGRHIHTDAQPPAASALHSDAAHYDHGSISTVASDDTLHPVIDHHKASGGQCCGMVCMTALPANFIELVPPPQPTSLRLSMTYRNLAGKAPPRLYRPPIIA